MRESRKCIYRNVKIFEEKIIFRSCSALSALIDLVHKIVYFYGINKFFSFKINRVKTNLDSAV